MKDLRFFYSNQNVYKTYTGAGSRVIQELVCIGIDIDAAKRITNALNAANQLLKESTAKDTGLNESRNYAEIAIN